MHNNNNKKINVHAYKNYVEDISMSRLHIMVIKIYTNNIIQGSKITNPDVYMHDNNSYRTEETINH